MSGSPSAFDVRGVIEGFYGNPYTHEQRLELVDFLADRGMNTFVYGPKDDPLVRARWRDPYDGGALHRLAELVNRCRARDVQLMYCVSPGLSMRYSDPRDMDALVAKLASVADLGVDAFGLLLDDIPMELQHAEDRVAFSDLAEAHAAVIRTLADRLGPGRQLAVCPTVYWGRGDEACIARLGAAIPGDVDLFWTGRAICSPTLDLDDARRFENATGRARPLLGQLPRQRRRHDVRAAHRALPRPGPPPGRGLARDHRQPDGTVRGVEDPAGHDRGLPPRPRRLRPRGELGGRDPRGRRSQPTQRPSPCSRTMCARPA